MPVAAVRHASGTGRASGGSAATPPTLDQWMGLGPGMHSKIDLQKGVYCGTIV